jgi:toxin FitB
MYLLDTDVLSQGAPSKVRPNAGVRAWLERHGDGIHLSAVSLTEISYGIAWLKHRGAARKAALLDAWLRDVVTFYVDRIVPVDLGVSLRAGELIAEARANGTEVDAQDAWIAATADLKGMTVLTGNAKRFGPMGVKFVNPFENLPPDIVANA